MKSVLQGLLRNLVEGKLRILIHANFIKPGGYPTRCGCPDPFYESIQGILQAAPPDS